MANVETRKSHVRRIEHEDDPDVWVDVQRADVIKIQSGTGITFKRTYIKLFWADEDEEDRHPTRKLELKRLKNPDDENQYIDIPVISVQAFRNSAQTLFKKFMNDAEDNQSRKLAVRRVYHTDTVANPNDDPEAAYEKVEGTEDQGQYIDTFVIDKYATTHGQGPGFIRRIFKLNTEPIKKHSVEAPDDVDKSTLVYLDPFQNIINVQWGGMWVAAVKASGGQIRLYHSLDGKEWSSRDLTASDGFSLDATVSYGNGKWLMAGAHGGAPLYQSDDGINWTSTPNPMGFGWIYSACFGNGIHVLGGWGDYAWSDDNGETWHVQPLPYDGDIVSSLNFIRADPDNEATEDRFFMGLRSPSGEASPPDDIDNRLQLMTSTDGMDWSAPQTLFLDVPETGLGDEEDHHLGAVLGLNGVVYGNGKYVVSGGVEIDPGGPPSGSDVSRIFTATSPDGLTWGASNDSGVAHAGGAVVGFQAAGQNIAFGNETFVVAGATYAPGEDQAHKGMIAASTDGVSWTSVFTGVVYHAMSEVDFGGGLFTAGGVRGVGEVSAVLMWSEDGHEWNYSTGLEHADLSQTVFIRRKGK